MPAWRMTADARTKGAILLLSLAESLLRVLRSPEIPALEDQSEKVHHSSLSLDICYRIHHTGLMVCSVPFEPLQTHFQCILSGGCLRDIVNTSQNGQISGKSDENHCSTSDGVDRIPSLDKVIDVQLSTSVDLYGRSDTELYEPRGDDGDAQSNVANVSQKHDISKNNRILAYNPQQERDVTDLINEVTNSSRGMSGTAIHIETVHGGTGGSGGSGTYGGAGGMGEGPNFSAGVMHINNMYGASHQVHTMLLPWFAPKALFDADAGAGTPARRGCTENTRMELIAHLKQWAAPSSHNGSPIFWLSGMAGTGKSTVAYTLCEYWRAQGCLGASFFCSRNDEKARSRISIIPTIVQQLLPVSKEFTHFVENVPIQVVLPASAQHVDKLLVQPWSMTIASQSEEQLQRKGLVVVIDALDEIENGQGSELIKQLIQAISTSKGFGELKFFVTSRPHPRIVNECNSIDHRAVYHMEDIDPKEASQDVRRFLDTELSDLSPLQRDNITVDSGGLFIYASTIVRYLHPPNFVLSSIQKTKRLTALKSTGSHPMRPGNQYEFLIDSLYKVILTEALPDIGEEVEISKRVLYCVVTTRLPLKVSDLAPLVIDVTEELDEKAVHNSLQLFYAVLYVSPQDKCIYTFHKSFTDFILDPHRSPELADPARSYFGDRAYGCLAIMSKSLQFNICNLTSSFLLDEDDHGLPERVATNIGPELRYACAATFNSAGRVLQFENPVLDGGNELAKVELSASIASSSHLVTASLEGNTMQVWDAATGNEVTKMEGHTGGVRSVAFSPNGAQIVSGSSDKTARIWDTTTGNEVTKMEGHTDWVRSVAFSPNGAQIVSGSDDRTVRLWDATTGNEVIKMEGHTDWVRSVAFSFNGAQIVSGSEDKTVQVWDAMTGNKMKKIEGHTGSVHSVAFSPDDAQIVTGSDDKAVKLWDASTGNEIMQIQQHSSRVWSVVFSLSGAEIVSCSDDKTVRVWDTMTGNELTRMEGHTGSVYSVAFSPNGAHIVSGSSDKTVQIWDATIANEATEMGGHTGAVNSVAFSPNGAQIVSGSEDGTIQLWDSTTGNGVRKMEGHVGSVHSVAFSFNESGM
ncbi:WD40 repeat-like protein [Mycena sanguinolenta]|uniref:WD40 repeat-like protein n=1 Tax=Mycena sanguinolenta TaxID=230812 RepID=A0A8H6ZAZ5_9AGAR|nr:WD40 repeat-like protein [Mycena sanguinolenta]